jgi:plastocyanin
MPASAAMITIKNFGFTVVGHIAPGAKVMIHNDDSEAHTVTADSGNAFDVSAPASSMAILTAPAKAGTYKFHCNFHSNMHGTLTVK